MFRFVLSGIAVTLFCSNADAQVQAGSGVNLKNTGHVINAPAYVAPNAVVTGTGKTSWEFTPTYQNRLVPVSQFTGLNSNNTYLNFEDLLPLKATKLRIMTGAAGAAPTGIGTLIDAQGIDTNALVTDSLQILDVTTGQLRQISFANGVLSVPGGIQMGDEYGNLVTNSKAVSLGGNGNVASGEGAVVMGGFNPGVGQQNMASGTGSLILAAKAARVQSTTSAVIGGQGNQILGNSSVQSLVLGGQGNALHPGTQGNNAIIAGGNNQMVSGAAFNVMAGGSHHTITNGGYNQAIVGGQYASMGNAPNSAIVGGWLNRIPNNTLNSGWITTSSGILGGYNNEIAADSVAAVILGGANNVANALGAAIMGSANSSVTGQYSSVVGGFASSVAGARSLAHGLGTRATGDNQVVMGKYNAADVGKAFIVGNGMSDSSRSNALTVDWNGKVTAPGGVMTGPIEAASITADKIHLRFPQGNVSMGAFTDD